MTACIDLTATSLTLTLPSDAGIISAMGPRSAIPKECWNAYYCCNPPRDMKGIQIATTPEQIGWLVSEMFYKGISSLKLNLKPHVTNTEREVLTFFRTFLGSMRPKHEHKFAWCIYLLSRCCTSVEWGVR